MTDGRQKAADSLVGTKIGSYRIERKLGEGGMGAVYELLHPGIGKRLAMKLLHAEYAAKPQIVKRFFDEARSVNMIGHPNIVDILDFAELPDGQSYLTMEFLPGESLDAYIGRTGALSVADVRAIIIPICSALGAAHERGIVHRDLKPENVHLVPRRDNPRYVKVLDFGIAKLSSELQLSPGHGTRSGVVMGTPMYMSPEQAMGRTKQIDHRTDIYALGIILYEMLSGEVPFSAESFGDLMLKHLQEPPRSLHEMRPDLPEPWNQVVQTALAKDRAHRFQTMADFAHAVERAAAGQPMAANPGAVAAAATSVAMGPGATVAATPGALGSSPPAMPGPGGTMGYEQGPAAGPQGTMAYGQQPAQITVPAASAPSGASRTGERRRKNKALLPILVGLIAIATIVTVLIILKPGGGGGDGAGGETKGAVATTHDAADRVAKAVVDAGALPADAKVVVAKVTIDAGKAKVRKPAVVTTRKDRGHGWLQVTADPWAWVLVRGSKKKLAGPKMKLPVGTYRLKIWNPEATTRGTKRKTVRIRRDRTTEVKVNFQ